MGNGMEMRKKERNEIGKQILKSIFNWVIKKDKVMRVEKTADAYSH